MDQPAHAGMREDFPTAEIPRLGDWRPPLGPADEDPDPPRTRAGARGARRPALWQTLVRGAGELLVTFGVVVLLFVFYELYVTDLFTAQAQSHLSGTLHDTWHSDPTAQLPARPAVGTPIAVVHIPRLGADYQRVVVEGTDQTQLAEGPGHYVGTAMPGQQGDVALAGHRVGKGSPFLDLDTIRPGDPIVVETASQWFVYRVLGDARTGSFTSDPSGIPGMQVVQPTALEVISPTPDAAAGAAPSGAFLTITTCNPKYSARTRLVVHARLDGGAIDKSRLPNGPSALHER